MITIRKLRTLPDDTRRRKISRLIGAWVRTADLPASSYLRELLLMIHADSGLPALVRARAAELAHALASTGEHRSQASTGSAELESAANAGPGSDSVIRALDTLRYLILQHLGEEPAEWDLDRPRAGADGGAHGVGPERSAATGAQAQGLERVALYLESVRSPFNLGSMLRTAAAFGVTTVGMSSDCPDTAHRRVQRSAMGACDYLQMVRGEVGLLRDEYDGPLIALELGGTPIERFDFPEEGILLLGSEELGLSPVLLAQADERLTIPMHGPKASLNVGVACGIALAAWHRSLAE